MSKLYFYRTNSEIDQEVRDYIIDANLDRTTMQGGQGSLNALSNLRKSKVKWIPTNHWIAGMMSHYIHAANTEIFQYDLTYWESDIQYTIYDEGDRYGWHVDTTQNLEIQRKLSISLCLSSPDEYEGGEFQILCGRTRHTIKMEIGDVIVFPSDTWHRVKNVRSGQRISLVGWYTGPRFR